MLQCQIVNLSPTEQDVPVVLHNITSGPLSAVAKQTVITGPSPQAENSFEKPDLVRLSMLLKGQVCPWCSEALMSHLLLVQHAQACVIGKQCGHSQLIC